MNHSFKTFAGLLLGAVAIVGCQREPVNPDFHPDTNEVTAQLILNVSAGQGTKMTAGNVQGDTQQTFLGIDNVKIVSFDSGRSAAPYYVSSSALAGNKVFTLGEVYGSGGITGENNDEKSNRILELNIPVGTDVMLFYGKAINKSPGKQTGWQDGHVDLEPSKTYFKLKSRMGDASNEGPYFKTAQLMAFILNRIFGTTIDADSQKPTELPALSWATLGDQYEKNAGIHDKAKVTPPVEIGGLGEILAAFYANMMYIPSTEYRAGSAVAVQNMINDLYSVLAQVQGASATDNKEINAQRLATAIKDKADNYFTTGTGGTYVFKSRDAIKSKLVELSIMTATEFETEFGTGTDNPEDFPYKSFGVPEGAAQLTHPTLPNSTTLDLNKLAYKIPNRALLNTSTVVDFSPTHYTYPAELTYYVHSPIRVTEEQNTANKQIFPDGTTAWASDASWTGNGWVKNGSVGTATRSVALVDNINYGVAMLKTEVKFKENISVFHDNRAAISAQQGGNDQDRDILPGNLKLKLTGVLVGGQNKMMNWQFLKRGVDVNAATMPEGITAAEWSDKTTLAYDYNNFNYVVYDDDIASNAVPTTAPNYTLLYDNYDSSIADDKDQSPVNVALEFINEGDDFWGKDNLIRKGGKFYLLAELNPKSASTENGYSVADGITWPTDHQIPPLYGIDGEAVPSGKTAGQSKQIKRIFIQDYVTAVTFRLGEDSLKKAYVSVPDLRSSQFSLGLSVDIVWSTGYTFDILIK